MWTRGSHRESFAGKIDGAAARGRPASGWLSLRPRDAKAGAIALVLIASGVMLVPVAASLHGEGTPFGRALTIVILLFAPSLLAAVYSLLFEKSKVYGCLDLVLIGVTLQLESFTRYWAMVYLPFACAFTIFCAVVRALDRAKKR